MFTTIDKEELEELRSRPLKRYLLTDGTTITRDELAEQAGLTIRNASCRLQRSNVREVLFKPVRELRAPRNTKEYELDNGQSLTIRQMMDITGCKYATQISRVYKHKDKADIILLPVTETLTAKAEQKLKNKIHDERMLGDADGFWALFNKYV